MALVCISFSQLGIQLVSESIHFHESCHSFESFKDCIVCWRIVFRLVKSMLPSLWSCHLMFKRETVLKVYTCSQNNLFESVTFDSVLWLHYLQHSRTFFLVSCHRCGIHHGPPLTRLFLSTSAHHPGISLINKKIVPWGMYALMTYSLTLDIGSHHWPLIHRIDWVFNGKTSIYTQ